MSEPDSKRAKVQQKVPRCLRCTHRLGFPVKQCEAGHLVCEPCQKRFTCPGSTKWHCIGCRKAVQPATRNLIADKMIEALASTSTDCELGTCNFTGTYAAVLAHESNGCPFAIVQCVLAHPTIARIMAVNGDVASPSDECSKLVTRRSMFEHLMLDHKPLCRTVKSFETADISLLYDKAMYGFAHLEGRPEVIFWSCNRDFFDFTTERSVRATFVSLLQKPTDLIVTMLLRGDTRVVQHVFNDIPTLDQWTPFNFIETRFEKSCYAVGISIRFDTDGSKKKFFRTASSTIDMATVSVKDGGISKP